MTTDADLYAAELALVRQQLDEAQASLTQVDALLSHASNHTHGI